MKTFDDRRRIYLRLSAKPTEDVVTEDFANLVRDVSLLTDMVTIARTDGVNSPRFNKAMSFRHGPRPPKAGRLRLEFVAQSSPLELIASLPAGDEATLSLVRDLITLGYPIADAFLRRLGERAADLLNPRSQKPATNGGQSTNRELPAVPEYDVKQQRVDYPAILKELRESGGGRMIERTRHRVISAPGYQEIKTEVEREIEVHPPTSDDDHASP